MYVTTRTRKTEEQDRQRCLEQAVHDLLELRANRLALDSRSHRDIRDLTTIYQALGRRPADTNVTYEHLKSAGTPLLWIPDAVAWCYGAGGDWRRRVLPIVRKVVDL